MRRRTVRRTYRKRERESSRVFGVRLSERIVHSCCGRLAHARHDVAVGVQDDGCSGVAKQLLYELGVNTLAEK